MFAIFTTLRDAQACADAETAPHGYPRDGTDRHVSPRRHPGGRKWAVDRTDALVPLPAGTVVVDSLPDDWTPSGVVLP